MSKTGGRECFFVRFILFLYFVTIKFSSSYTKVSCGLLVLTIMVNYYTTSNLETLKLTELPIVGNYVYQSLFICYRKLHFVIFNPQWLHWAYYSYINQDKSYSAPLGVTKKSPAFFSVPNYCMSKYKQWW